MNLHVQQLETNQKFNYNILISILLISRFLSEIINNFLWERSNYLWSILALISISTLSWPSIVSEILRGKKLFFKYLPIVIYLLYLFLRLNFLDLYSIKCFFSEFIVMFLFIYTTEISHQSFNAMKTVQIWIIRLVKITIIIGIIQLAVFILLNNNINPIYIFNSRPVKGIFAHPNIYLVVILPFLFYFLKKHLYYWIPLVLLTCLGTGTRAPFLAILCMFIIIFKSFLRKKISWSNICVTLLIVAISYTLIIALYSEKQSTDFQDSNRFTLGTLQWRIEFWKNFLEINYDYSTFLGKGIGSADILSANLLDREISYPHSDYLRIYYDTGIIGLLLFLNLIRFFLCIIKKMIAPESDFILLTYLIIVCFYITDNFLYCTHSIFVYMFIASYLNFPSMSRSFNEDSINQ